MLEVARKDSAGELTHILNFEFAAIFRPTDNSFVFRLLSQP